MSEEIGLVERYPGVDSRIITDCFMRGWEARNEAIVRCRDCVHYQPDWFAPQTPRCWRLDGENPAKVEPGGFCAWGERCDD